MLTGAYAALPLWLSVMGASYRTTRQVATAYLVAEALSLGSLDPLGVAAALTCGAAALGLDWLVPLSLWLLYPAAVRSAHHTHVPVAPHGEETTRAWLPSTTVTIRQATVTPAAMRRPARNRRGRKRTSTALVHAAYTSWGSHVSARSFTR